MHIVLISDWFRPRAGGIEGQVSDLARALTARGHDVEIVCATPGPSLFEDVPVHRIAEERLLPHVDAAWRPATFRRLRRIIENGRFDLVHAHSAYSPLALGACRIARNAGIPSLLTEHSLFRGGERVAMRMLDAGLGWSTWPSHLTAVSRRAADDLGVISGRDVEVLPDGLAVGDWPVRDAASGSHVVSVLRLMPRKRCGDLVAAMPHVLAARQWTNAPHLVIVGDGPERRRLQRLAARLGVAEAVTFAGRLEHADIRMLYADAALFVLPTRKEALSVATLEAMASGLPVVAMAGSGVDDLVEPGREGFLATDRHGLAASIVTLLEDAALRTRAGALAREKAERFDWSLVLDRYLAAYDRTIAIEAARTRSQAGALTPRSRAGEGPARG